MRAETQRQRALALQMTESSKHCDCCAGALGYDAHATFVHGNPVRVCGRECALKLRQIWASPLKHVAGWTAWMKGKRP